MGDQERFEAFKQKLVEDNEQQYGQEIRAKYGEEAVERSNARIRDMSKEQFAEIDTLTAALNQSLKEAFEQGDPAGELAQKACELHKRWLCFYWDQYSKEAHLGVAHMYVEDPRFSAYYDQIVPGCAVFLRDALQTYCK